jgi:hypothetical protein
VQASIPDASGVVHACYNTSLAHGSPTGALRAIDTSAANGNCAPWEGAVDLATAQFVTSTVNQTSFMETFSFTYPFAGDWVTFFTCPTGYVAIDPQIWADTLVFNIFLTQRAETNDGTTAGGPPNNGAMFVYNVSGGVPLPAHQHITCVDGRVYGQAGPAAPLTQATATATAKVTKIN